MRSIPDGVMVAGFEGTRRRGGLCVFPSHHDENIAHTAHENAKAVIDYSDVISYSVSGEANASNATIDGINQAAYIAPMDNDEKLVALRAFIPPQLRNEFKSICVKEGLTMNDVILEFVEDFVKKHDSNRSRSRTNAG